MKKFDKIVILGTIGALSCLSYINHTESIETETRKAEPIVTTITPKTIQLKEDPIAVKSIEIKDFKSYTDDLGFKESSNNYSAENQYGYIGKYQFGTMALKDLKLHKLPKSQFKKNTELQETAFNALLSINKYRLRNFIDKYNGKTINGIVVTESGLLAASHLVGAKAVKKFLRTNGKKSKSDANGTTIEIYLSKFGGYDTSNIKAQRKYDLSSISSVINQTF